MNNVINRFLLSSFALLLFSGINGTNAFAQTDNRAPDVPDEIAVPEGNKVHFHGFAEGVQIYTCNGTKFGPASVPDATLYDEDGNVVATHFAGPTWRSNSGSEVVGALPPLSKVVDDSAIAWLRLAADENRTHGPGIFEHTTFVHRVNTVGGKAPKGPCSPVGSTIAVPYTADYFFYRKANQ